MKIRQLLKEAAGITASFAFGRFNPAHQGHIAVWQTVEKSGVKWYIGTNPTTIGPNDPLTFEQKKAWMEEIYPQIQGHIVPEQSVVTLAVKIFNDLGKNEDSTIGYVTDDTDWAWSGKLLNQYNGVEGKHGYYKFAQIVHIPSPRVSSATALRDAARAGDKAAFYHASGTDPKLKVNGKTYFDTVAEACAKYPLPVKKAKKTEGVAEGEKNPFEKGSMGHALWRDLSKTKKASPAQQQRNRERFAKIDAEKAKQPGVAEGTVYPNAEVIKTKNGKPVGEIYQDGNSWGCFHYRADRGYDLIDSREDAIEALKDLHQETGRARPDYTIKGEVSEQGVAEGAGNIGNAIKSLYQKIYRAGDDEIEYFYNDSPIFAQYWDEYEGDLNSIIAEVDPAELQVMLDELESYVEQANLGEARMSAAVKLQRAFDRERAKSDASRRRGEEVMSKARADYSKHEKSLISKMSNDEKVDKGWRNPNVKEGGEQIYKVIALDKSNALGGKEEMTVKADSIEDLFDRLSANDWYPLEINGVEVIAGKRLKQDVAEDGVESWAGNPSDRRHSGHESYMTPEYMLAHYKKRLAQIAAGKHKYPKEVAQLQAKIAKLEKQGVAEMDSQGYTGTRDRKSMSTYGSRDKDEPGQGPDQYGTVMNTDDFVKHALDSLTKELGKDEVDEASLSAMRDYFSGEGDGYDPMTITQMRQHYGKEGDVTSKRKEFRSEWEYQQWLKKQKLKQLTKPKVKESQQNWVQLVMEKRGK